MPRKLLLIQTTPIIYCESKEYSIQCKTSSSAIAKEATQCFIAVSS